MALSIIALVFGTAGFLILWFGGALKVQLLGAALLTAALTLLLAGFIGSHLVIHLS